MDHLVTRMLVRVLIIMMGRVEIKNKDKIIFKLLLNYKEYYLSFSL